MKKTTVRILVFAVLIFLFDSGARKNSRYYKEKYFKDSENRTEALGGLRVWSDAASFPGNDIPSNAFAKAMQWYQENPNLSQERDSQAATAWKTLGPMNMGGRTLALAFDPTDTATIWLGSAGGGLWKSKTGGIGTYAWTYVPLGFPVLGVSCIAINPSNKNEMYVGSGEVYNYGSNSQGIGDLRVTRGSYGMGLFKSTDGGATWTQSINWTYQQNRGIWDIAINPLKPSTVYAATTEGVYKSTDAGATWTQVLSQQMCMDLEIHNVDTNILLCGVGNNGSTVQGVFRTTSSGASWSRVTSGLPTTRYQGRITLTKYKNNNDIMYAHICDVYNSIGIYKSADKGQSWTLVTSQDIASYQGWYSKGMVVQPSNPNNVLAGGVYVYNSANGGSSFNQASFTYHSDIHDLVVNPLDPNKVYILTDGGLYRSNDFGASFYECNGGYNTTQHYIGSISSTDTTVLLSGLQDNYTIKYFGNYNWYPEIGGDGCYNAIDHTNHNIQYGAYQYLNVYKDPSSQGNNLSQQILTYNTSATGGNYAAFLAPYVLCYSNTSYIYAGGQTLQRSTNGGSTWAARGATYGQIMTIGVSFTNTDSIYFACCPNQSNPMKIYRSPDGGATVTDISAGLPNRYPRRIAVNPSNSKEIYVVFSGFGTGHVFKSTDAGTTWTDISTNLPDMPFECIVVDPANPNFVYTGCDYGVFVSGDKGQTWQSYDNGFPDITMVFDLVVSPHDRSLYAFTHGRGIYKRSLSDLVTDIQHHARTNARVYPNPSSDYVQIEIPSADAAASYMAFFYTVEGKQIFASQLHAEKNRIDLSSIVPGAYVISIHRNGMPWTYTSIVKQ